MSNNKKSTLEEFINKKNIRGVWPYLPSGILKKPSRKPSGVGQLADKHFKEFETAVKFVDDQIRSRFIFITWILTAIIGVLGNLLITTIFSEPRFSNFRNFIAFEGLLILILLIIIGLSFIHPISFRVDFIPDYVDFPKGYGQYIDYDSLSSPYARIKIQFDFIDEVVINFGRLIRLMIFRDYINKVIEETKYIKIENIAQAGAFLPNLYLTLSTTWLARFTPINREIIINEFMRFTGSLTNCRITCNVLAFETSSEEWIQKGPKFLDTVSGWDFESGIIQILNQIQRS